MKRWILILIAGCLVALSLWIFADIDLLSAAEIIWTVLMVTVVGLLIYRVRIGSFPRHFRRSVALSNPTANGKIQQVDIVGASLTFVAIIYSVLLALLIADAMLKETIRKVVRLIAF